MQNAIKFKVLPFLVLCCLFGTFTSASSQEDPRTLSAEATKLEQDAADLVKRLKNIQLLDSQLDIESKNLQREYQVLAEREKSVRKDVDDFNGRLGCGGRWHEPGKKRQCDAIAAEIIPRQKALEKAALQYAARVQSFKDKQYRQNEIRMKWELDNSTYRAHLREWRIRVSNVLQQLQGIANSSAACASIPGIEEFETNLNGAAELAKRCLDDLWDRRGR